VGQPEQGGGGVGGVVWLVVRGGEDWVGGGGGRQVDIISWRKSGRRGESGLTEGGAS